MLQAIYTTLDTVPIPEENCSSDLYSNTVTDADFDGGWLF